MHVPSTNIYLILIDWNEEAFSNNSFFFLFTGMYT